MRIACTLLIALLCAHGIAQAQSTPSSAPPAPPQSEGVSAPDPTEAITRLREELVDSFNKGDIDRLLSHLAADVVVTWQDGTVCRTPAEVRAYYDRMMTGPSRIVKSLTAAPVVDGRQIHGDWAVSWGHMNDHFELSDGQKLNFDSRFTATISRDGDVWKVSSFHASIDAFENPVLQLAVRRTALWAGGVAGGIGLAIGSLVGIAVGRRPRRAA